ncbi:hypothetical protein BDR04DRAFT_365586 [Suillus decipiens]|nr:hypothetical protein BDR04DRAFT_365586 [Suillus decipiens]
MIWFDSRQTPKVNQRPRLYTLSRTMFGFFSYHCLTSGAFGALLKPVTNIHTISKIRSISSPLPVFGLLCTYSTTLSTRLLDDALGARVHFSSATIEGNIQILVHCRDGVCDR